MKLINKRVSTRQLAANRRNSLKSTGPRTTTGKRNASRNALRHGLFAKSMEETFRQLGEDPADYQAMLDSLREAFQPKDGFEEMLIEDMAVCRWRLNRLLRAETGIQVWDKQRFEFDRKRKDAVNGESDYREGQMKLFSSYGYSGLQDSRYKFSTILSLLRNLKDSAQETEVDEKDKNVLEVVYGKIPSMAGLSLLSALNSWIKETKSKKQIPGGFHRAAFLQEISMGIRSFENLAKLHEEKEEQLSDCRSNALLLPDPENMDRILRYEAALERQFERKVQLLVSLRRAKGEAAPADVSPSGRSKSTQIISRQ